jgi:hypothetical protein
MNSFELTRVLLTAMLRQLALADVSTMSNIRDEKSVSLLLVDRWLSQETGDATRLARVAWLLGRACAAMRVVELCNVNLSHRVAMVSSSLLAHLCRAFLAVAGTSPAIAPLRAWAHVYSIDDKVSLATVDARASLFLLLAGVREVTDRLWAGAMALQAAARVGDSTFYLRICEFMVRTIEPEFVSGANAFAPEDTTTVGTGAVLLREPIIPRHNEPTSGFGKQARRFMPFERRVLVAKRQGVTLPLLAPRLAALMACVPVDDFRCWWLALLCCAASQIGDSVLCDAAAPLLVGSLSTSPDSLIAMALCAHHGVTLV